MGLLLYTVKMQARVQLAALTSLALVWLLWLFLIKKQHLLSSSRDAFYCFFNVQICIQ